MADDGRRRVNGDHNGGGGSSEGSPRKPAAPPHPPVETTPTRTTSTQQPRRQSAPHPPRDMERELARKYQALVPEGQSHEEAGGGGGKAAVGTAPASSARPKTHQDDLGVGGKVQPATGRDYVVVFRAGPMGFSLTKQEDGRAVVTKVGGPAGPQSALPLHVLELEDYTPDRSKALGGAQMGSKSSRCGGRGVSCSSR